MKKRMFGNSGLQVLMHAAVERGVTMFDAEPTVRSRTRNSSARRWRLSASVS
jgi:hypothetical protein